MPSLIFDKCCGCIELKSGCLIIGYLELVSEIIIGIFVLLALVAGGAAASSNDEEKHRAGIVILVFVVILALVLALLLAFTITLLLGLHKNKRGYVKAYLIYSAIFIVLGVILFFASLSQPIPTDKIVSNFFGLLLHFYFLLVIRSQYYKMDDTSKGAIYNTA